MHDRAALGPADVDDPTLAGLVADLLGHDEVELLSSAVEPVAYDVPALTTVARHWVHGEARTPLGVAPWRVFVKHVQAWHHSPFFAAVPPEAHAFAAASYPWRTEPLVYRSDLADRLPAGLSMPRALAVVDLEPDAAAIWLPEVATLPRPWTSARYERAAHLLGRLAASADVAPLADVGAFEWSVMHYVHGRLAAGVLPVLEADEPWGAPGFAVLRDRVRAHAARVEAYAAELMALPRATSHGDASPGNLLPGASEEELVLIDFGFWMSQPVGFDLGQLVAGDTQLGRGPDDLAAVDAACVTAYVQGLAAEGTVLDVEVVRRAHALQLFLFAGISALPEPGMPDRQVARRAELAAYSLDLLDATG